MVFHAGSTTGSSSVLLVAQSALSIGRPRPAQQSLACAAAHAHSDWPQSASQSQYELSPVCSGHWTIMPLPTFFAYVAATKEAMRSLDIMMICDGSGQVSGTGERLLRGTRHDRLGLER